MIGKGCLGKGFKLCFMESPEKIKENPIVPVGLINMKLILCIRMSINWLTLKIKNKK